MIKIRFEPGSNEEFVGEDCVAKYEAAIIAEASKYFEQDVELCDDSPFGTKIEIDDDDPFAMQDAEDGLHYIMEKIGNNLTEICS